MQGLEQKRGHGRPPIAAERLQRVRPLRVTDSDTMAVGQTGYYAARVGEQQ